MKLLIMMVEEDEIEHIMWENRKSSKNCIEKW
jgi:hypothetical protein